MKKCGIFALLAAIVLSALFMTACSKQLPPSANESKTLASVAQDSIVFTVDGNVFNVSWKAVENATSYEITIGDFTFITQSTSVDLNSIDGLTLPSDKFVITITAKADGWISSAPTTKTYDAEAEQLQYTVEIESVENSVLKWKAIKDVKSYRVVDVDFNVTTVTGTSYDMFDKNIVLGVYAVVNSFIFDITDIEPSEINYLEGDGTEGSPYLIKKPFDLRAIDYYEARYFNENKQNRNYYKIVNDMDYHTVNVLEGVSNMYTIRKPFFGTLDGDGKKLSNVYVNYDGGYWAMFDFLATGSVVKNIVFDNPEINNELQTSDVPINASIATVAYRNYGTVSAITVSNAKYTAKGGEVSGIVSHNFGTVENCEVGGTFKQGATGQNGQACYEMAGVVLENCKGGEVKGNKVTTLTITGTQCTGDNGTDKYNNVRSAAGIVSVNRSGGTVTGNSFTSLTMTYMLNYYNESGAPEWGGIVAYNALGGTVSGNTAGTFKWGATASTTTITLTSGTDTDHRGKIVGKNDGSAAS